MCSSLENAMIRGADNDVNQTKKKRSWSGWENQRGFPNQTHSSRGKKEPGNDSQNELRRLQRR